MNISSAASAAINLSNGHAQKSVKATELPGHNAERHSEFKAEKRAEAFQGNPAEFSKESSSGFHAVG